MRCLLTLFGLLDKENENQEGIQHGQGLYVLLESMLVETPQVKINVNEDNTSALKVIEEGVKWMKAMSLHGPSFSLSRVCSVGFGSDTVHINS